MARNRGPGGPSAARRAPGRAHPGAWEKQQPLLWDFGCSFPSLGLSFSVCKGHLSPAARLKPMKSRAASFSQPLTWGQGDVGQGGKGNASLGRCVTLGKSLDLSERQPSPSQSRTNAAGLADAPEVTTASRSEGPACPRLPHRGSLLGHSQETRGVRPGCDCLSRNDSPVTTQVGPSFLTE